jgi:hypothetical protein
MDVAAKPGRSVGAGQSSFETMPAPSGDVPETVSSLAYIYIPSRLSSRVATSGLVCAYLPNFRLLLRRVGPELLVVPDRPQGSGYVPPVAEKSNCDVPLQA